ncbi:MAG: hypothetical protein RM347_009065 [Nostoc sp. ChiQUE02]|uniref:hypothetical protein n=1 Tax=Nostoc sp. ChiQUE02 TaxID=3075377 RepID=UPI002AD36AFD|nr:hypothetical protein [Nostoc sp. ChiQUE02]MDZ8232901.1 hypothetical protein [Nostoc sp. ChiQUE02]
MAEPTLAQIFGAGATQDANTLTIQKSALATVGLTASGNNTAESLFVALVLKAKDYLTATALESNADQNISIADGYVPSFIIRNNVTYRQDDITVSMQKSAGSTTIDPDDY